MSKANVYIKQEQADALRQADAAMKAAGLGGLQINSGYRSFKEQQRLYNQLKGKQAVAPPGKSAHNAGTDVDIQNYAAAKPFLEAAGFKWSNYRNDPWHFQWVGGGGQQRQQQQQRQSQPKAQAITPKAQAQAQMPQVQPSEWYTQTMARMGATVPKAIETPSVNITPVKVPDLTKPDADLGWIDNFIQDVKEYKAPPPPVPVQPEKNLFEQFGAGFSNPITGYTQDEAAAQLAGKPVYEAGQIGGDIVANIAGAVGGGFITGGNPLGVIGGRIITGSVLSGAAELQRQRLAGEQTSLGKAGGAAVIGGGLSAIPTIKQTSRFIPRVAANAALQGGLQGLGSVAQQAIEQGTLTPNVDINRTLVQAGIGGAGGAVGGAFDAAPQLHPRLPRQAAGQVTDFVPAAQRVRVTTPAVGQTLGDTMPGKPIEIGPGGVEIQPTQTPATATEQLTLFPEFAVPNKPVVRDIEYTPKIQEGPDVTPGINRTRINNVDAALYDLAVDPTDEVALKAAREALPGYGDENIRSLAYDVRDVVDNAVQRNEAIPENITQRRVKPQVKPDDAVMGVNPTPESPDTIKMKARQLKGSRDEMIAQGTEGTIVRSKADYDALLAHQKELKGITQRANRLALMDDLTDDVVIQRAEEILTSTGLNGYAVPDGSYKRIQAYWTKVQDGSATDKTITALRKEIADADLRTEIVRVKQQLDEMHPNVREAFSHNYDPETGLATQKNLNGGKSLDEIKDGLTPEQYNLAKDWENAAKADAQIKVDADTNISGATSRVAERTVTPLGFRMDKDGHIAGLAYNEDGHFASYYFTKKPAGNGEFSTINSVGEMVNTPGYRGSYANMYQGVREFSIDSLLKRPSRGDGIRTSEALQVAERARSLSSRTDLMAENPKLAKILRDLEDNPRSATVETIRDMETLLKTEPKLLKKLCQILGKAS